MPKNRYSNRPVRCKNDAQYWAKEFCKRYPNMDEGLMIGWFANAQMAAYDWIKEQRKHDG